MKGNTMHKLIEDTIRDYEEQIEKVKSFDSDLNTVEKIIKELDGFEDHGLTVDSCDINVTFYQIGNYKEFIVDLLRAFGKEGYNKYSDPHQNYDSTGMVVRLNGNIFIMMYVKNDGKCEMVQTGTKEVPVYEMKCD